MKKVILVSIACAALLASCGNPVAPSSNQSPSPSPSASPNPATPVSISGTVRSGASGDPVANALVSVGSRSGRSGIDGSFSFQAEALSGGAQLKAVGAGFIACQKTLPAASAGALSLDLVLLPETPAVVIDPAVVNTVTSPEGASVVLPALPGIAEPLAVSVTYIDAGSSAIESAPGDFSGIASDGSAASLVSRGMIDVNVTGVDSGDDYSLSGGSYTITVPIPANLDAASEGDKIPMWYFDEAQGKWIEQGEATKVGDSYVGIVHHFTTWNMDFKAPSLVTATGTIVDPAEGSQASCYDLTVSFPGYSWHSYYGQKGPFSILRLPGNTAMNLSFRNVITGEIVSKSITTPASAPSIDAGEFIFHQKYYAAVDCLAAAQGNGDVVVKWRDPSQTGLESVTLSFGLQGSPAVSTQRIASGVEAAAFPVSGSGGYYSITAVANYADGNSSEGRTILCKYSESYTFQMRVVIEPPNPSFTTQVYLTPGTGGTGRFLYSGETLSYPRGYPLRIDVVETNRPASYWPSLYNGYASTIDYYYKKDTGEIDYYVALGDDDYDLTLHYYSCGGADVSTR